MDYIKVSHKELYVLTIIINLIAVKYGRKAHIINTIGKLHDYIGTTINFSEELKCYFIGLLGRYPLL